MFAKRCTERRRQDRKRIFGRALSCHTALRPSSLFPQSLPVPSLSASAATTSMDSCVADSADYVPVAGTTAVSPPTGTGSIYPKPPVRRFIVDIAATPTPIEAKPADADKSQGEQPAQPPPPSSSFGVIEDASLLFLACTQSLTPRRTAVAFVRSSTTRKDVRAVATAAAEYANRIATDCAVGSSGNKPRALPSPPLFAHPWCDTTSPRSSSVLAATLAIISDATRVVTNSTSASIDPISAAQPFNDHVSALVTSSTSAPSQPAPPCVIPAAVVGVGNEPRIMCPFSGCGKLFVHPSSLRSHMVTHTQEREFPCDICDRPFARKSDMAKHKRTMHAPDRPIHCDVCRRSFTRRHFCRIAAAGAIATAVETPPPTNPSEHQDPLKHDVQAPCVALGAISTSASYVYAIATSPPPPPSRSKSQGGEETHSICLPDIGIPTAATAATTSVAATSIPPATLRSAQYAPAHCSSTPAYPGDHEPQLSVAQAVAAAVAAAYSGRDTAGGTPAALPAELPASPIQLQPKPRVRVVRAGAV
ncbi:hypothetical protein HK405_005495 [Cladochytrium tenue]|nr:hypothetical protein HK405_005495 [Cladochytrium tenue]